MQNARRDDAWEVIQAGIPIAIRAVEYTPTARDMRELASPLPFIGEVERVQSLVSQFAANKGNVERYGPTIGCVRLLLLLACAWFRHDFAKGRAWFEEAYLYTSRLADLAIKGECYARLLVALDIADPERRLELYDDA